MTSCARSRAPSLAIARLMWVLAARVLDDAVPGLEGRVAADALIGAFAREYRCEEPGDAELLDRTGRQVSTEAFAERFGRLRERHLRKPSLL